MIVDIVKCLLVSLVSSFVAFVLEYNMLGDGFLHSVSDFASSQIHDNGMLLLFHSDIPKMRVDIKGFMKTYHFSLFKECLGLNCLQMISGRGANAWLGVLLLAPTNSLESISFFCK